MSLHLTDTKIIERISFLNTFLKEQIHHNLDMETPVFLAHIRRKSRLGQPYALKQYSQQPQIAINHVGFVIIRGEC